MLSDKKRNDFDSQLKRSRAARIGGQARRKQYGYKADSGMWSHVNKPPTKEPKG